MKKSLAFLLVYLLSVPQVLALEKQAADLPGLIEGAFQNNPGLLSKKKDYEAKKAGVIDAWLLEDPEFGLDVEGQPELFEYDQRMNNEYMLQQDIPFPTKMLFRGLAASKEAEASYQVFREAERQIIWRLKEPYYKLLLAKKTIGLLEDSRKLLEQAAKSAGAMYESGQGMQVDVLKAQIELSKIDIELFNVRQEERLEEARFASVLNQPLNTRYPFHFSEERQSMSLTLQQLEEAALKNRPELKMFVLEAERAGLNQALAHQAWLPDIKLRYEGRQYPGENDIRENDTFIGLSVPVWSLLKGIGGGWASANAEAAAARERLAQARNDLLLDVHTAYTELKKAENALQVYEMSILPQAKQQVEVGLASYEAGKMDFLGIIDAQKTLRESQIEYYAALADYQIALAELSACCGVDL
jgi:outer membrane protein TolC